jgi:hypothetical protein
MAGRPTLLTPDVQARIVKAIQAGMTYRLACQYGGIDDETFRHWKIRGATGEEPYCGFLGAVKAAEAEGVRQNLARIEAAAEHGAWQASAWLLERRYPQEYGKTVQTQEHSGPGGGPIIQEDISALSPEARAARIAELEARRHAD